MTDQDQSTISPDDQQEAPHGEAPLAGAADVLQALEEASPERTLNSEWSATLAVIAASDLKWMKLIFIEMPHVVRAIISFPTKMVDSILRLALIATRVFVSSKTGVVVTPAEAELVSQAESNGKSDDTDALRPVSVPTNNQTDDVATNNDR